MSGLSHSCKSLLFNSFPSRDGRIELRGPSAPSARLAEDIRIYSRTLPTLGSNRRPPEPHYTQAIRHITGDARFH